MSKGVPNKRYTGEFKQEVIEDMRKNELSYKETQQKYGLPNRRVQDWERIYLAYGPEGFYEERRGRSSKGRPPKLPPQIEKDLLAEVQRLRAENDYLKKLNALVSQRVQQEKKPK